MTTSHKSVTKCKDSNCGICPYLKLASSFNFRGKEFTQIHIKLLTKQDLILLKVLYVFA